MPDIPFVIIPLVAFLAFFVKGAAGFGTALVLVPVSTLLVGVHIAVVMSSILDVVAGAVLFAKNPLTDHRRFWFPMAGGIMAGSVAGGLVLSVVPTDGFTRMLGFIVVGLGVWFFFGRSSGSDTSLPVDPPERASAADVAVSVFAGFCGGLFGISGPPIVYWLGRHLAKDAFRSTLVAVFLFGGIARVLTYVLTGLLTVKALLLAGCALPFVLFGLWVGNHLFMRLSERWFSRLIGVILVLSAIRLIT